MKIAVGLLSLILATFAEAREIDYNTRFDSGSSIFRPIDKNRKLIYNDIIFNWDMYGNSGGPADYKSRCPQPKDDKNGRVIRVCLGQYGNPGVGANLKSMKPNILGKAFLHFQREVVLVDFIDMIESFRQTERGPFPLREIEKRRALKIWVYGVSGIEVRPGGLSWVEHLGREGTEPRKYLYSQLNAVSYDRRSGVMTHLDADKVQGAPEDYLGKKFRAYELDGRGTPMTQLGLSISGAQLSVSYVDIELDGKVWSRKDGRKPGEDDRRDDRTPPDAPEGRSCQQGPWSAGNGETIRDHFQMPGEGEVRYRLTCRDGVFCCEPGRGQSACREATGILKMCQ